MISRVYLAMRGCRGLLGGKNRSWGPGVVAAWEGLSQGSQWTTLYRIRGEGPAMYRDPHWDTELPGIWTGTSPWCLPDTYEVCVDCFVSSPGSCDRGLAILLSKLDYLRASGLPGMAHRAQVLGAQSALGVPVTMPRLQVCFI